MTITRDEVRTVGDGELKQARLDLIEAGPMHFSPERLHRQRNMEAREDWAWEVEVITHEAKSRGLIPWGTL